MADVTFTEVVQLAEKLTPQEQQALIVYLQERSKSHNGEAKNVSKAFDEMFNLLVFDVGQWPEGMKLRREDEYGDDDR